MQRFRLRLRSRTRNLSSLVVVLLSLGTAVAVGLPAVSAAPVSAAPKIAVASATAPVLNLAEMALKTSKAPSAPSAASAPASARAYTVVSGDWLSKIAAREHTVGGWGALFDLNRDKISNPNLIFPGEVIRLDKAGSAAPAPAPVVVAAPAKPAVHKAIKKPVVHKAAHKAKVAKKAAHKPVKKAVVRLAGRTANFVNRYPFGQCTWGAAQLRHNNAFDGLGNAADWNNNAPRHGLRVGYSPRVGAVVVFERGVQGASSAAGHVGVVTQLLGGGRFVMKAMNDVAGFGHYSFRTAHTGGGVSFIY